MGDTQVTDDNKDNILNQVDANNQPTAKFNLGTDGEYILTLNNPTINGSSSQVIYANGIDAKIFCRNGLKIKGSYHMSENEQVAYGLYTIIELWFDGDFTFYGSSCGVYVEEMDVYMLSGSLKAIGGDYGLQSDGFEFSKETEINIELKGTVKACNSPTISFDDVAVLLSTPEDGFYDRENNQFYESDGTTIAKHVIFSTSFSYNIWLGETEVTRENMDNIFGDLGEPTATFDGHTLTLNNPTITGVHTFGRNNETAVIYSERSEDFKVVGTYHQSEATAQYGIWCNSIRFYLGGDFTFRGSEYGLYAKKRCILLTNRYTVNLSMFGETGAMYCPNFLQYDYLSKYLIYDPQGGRLHYDSPYFRDADENIAKGARTMLWDILMVGSTEVLPENCNDILGDGKASYDPATKTLTLNNPTIPGIYKGCKIYAERMDLTIKGSYHMDREEIQHGIYVNHGSLTLDGDFTFLGSSGGILSSGDITVKSGSLSAAGVSDSGDGFGIFGNKLTIEDGVSYVDLQGGTNALNLYYGGGLQLAQGYAIIIPENGIFQNNVIYHSDGTTIAKNAVIQNTANPTQFYDLWVGSTHVTSSNQNDILGDGKASFDPTTSTLTLNNPTITGVHTFGSNNETAVIYSGKTSEKTGLFQIVGTYHQATADAQYGVWCNSSLYLGGDFTFRGTDYGLYADNRCVLWTNRYNVSLTLSGGAGAMYCPCFRLSGYPTKHVICAQQGGELYYASPNFCDKDGNIAKDVVIAKWGELWLGSTKVVPDNFNDILGDGKASYDPATQTLTLDNPTIPGYDYEFYINGRPSGGADKIYVDAIDLTIKGSYHMDREEIQHGIYVNHGSLTLDGDFTFLGGTGILSDGDITVKSGNLTAIGMSDLGTGNGIFANSLTVEDGVDYIDLQGGTYPLNLNGGGGLHLANGYAITTPANGIFQNNVIYHSDGTTIATDAVIQDATNPIQFYDLWVGCKHVTSLNQNDILGDGKASFDPATNTLTLQDNPTIAGTTNHSKIYSKLSSLTITGSYHMTEEETQSGIRLDIGSLTLNGDFTFLSKGYWFIDYDGDPILNAGNPIWVAGDITLNGDITAEGHDLSDAAICTRNGNITV